MRVCLTINAVYVTLISDRPASGERYMGRIIFRGQNPRKKLVVSRSLVGKRTVGQTSARGSGISLVR